MYAYVLRTTGVYFSKVRNEHYICVKRYWMSISGIGLADNPVFRSIAPHFRHDDLLFSSLCICIL